MTSFCSWWQRLRSRRISAACSSVTASPLEDLHEGTLKLGVDVRGGSPVDHVQGERLGDGGIDREARPLRPPPDERAGAEVAPAADAGYEVLNAEGAEPGCGVLESQVAARDLDVGRVLIDDLCVEVPAAARGRA